MPIERRQGTEASALHDPGVRKGARGRLVVRPDAPAPPRPAPADPRRPPSGGGRRVSPPPPPPPSGGAGGGRPPGPPLGREPAAPPMRAPPARSRATASSAT